METTEQFQQRRARRILLDQWLLRARSALRSFFCFSIGACVGALMLYAFLPVRHDIVAIPITVKRPTLQLGCSAQEIREYASICAKRKG